MTEDIVMIIDKPHFVVKLHSTVLEVDVKDGVRKELERFVESKPMLRDSVGLLFQTVVPLDVRLKDIESVEIDKKGAVKIVVPSRRDLHIPLDATESERLIDKLNELIPKEKERALRDAEEAKKLGVTYDTRRGQAEKELARPRVEK